MKFILPFILFSISVFAQRPELSMELFLQPSYSQILPFTQNEIQLHKKLGIKKIKISTGQNSHLIYLLNNNGKPNKGISYHQVKSNSSPIDSTIFQYSKLNQVVSIKYFHNNKMELDSFSYSGNQLTGIFHKSMDSNPIKNCSNGFTTYLLLQNTTKQGTIFQFNNCDKTQSTYLDSLNNFVKQKAHNQSDSTSTFQDTTFYWQKKSGERYSLVKKETTLNRLPIKTLIKSSESNNWIQKEYSYNTLQQLVSATSTGTEGSKFFKYYTNGLLKTIIHSPSDPQWKYNYFLKPQKEVYTLPITKYFYQKHDGSWIK
jgi:hypothetical protein